MISMAVRFEIDTDNPKVAHTILDVMLTRGWDEPRFRDRRIEYKGIVQTPKRCAELDQA